VLFIFAMHTSLCWALLTTIMLLESDAFSVVTSSASVPAALPPLDPTTASAMEDTVRRYFQGVNEKDPAMIASCFGSEEANIVIRDVCALSATADASDNKVVSATTLVDRCMDFVRAHPDCLVEFYYGPECGRSSHWVVAHWYETGTWTGSSRGILATNQPMAVEGQTRFRVDPETLKIQELVVTRTFTEWEKAVMLVEQAED
jgi:hypothetical protein